MSLPSRTASISVLMPCLNPGVFLLEAVDSVMADPAVLELIVADGGSTDGSMQLLQQRAAVDQRLRLVCEPDSGPPDALNRAFALARGTVIGWLNADDRYLEGAPSRAVEALDQHPDWLLVYGEGHHIDANGCVLDLYPTRLPDVGLDGFRDYCFLCQPTAFWRRSLGVMLGPFDVSLKTCFDFDYWIRAFSAFPGRIGHLPVLQAQTRRHEATISATQLPRAVMESTLLQARLFPEARPHMVQAYLHQIQTGEIILPDGLSFAQHRDQLVQMTSSMLLPPTQLQLVHTLLQSLTEPVELPGASLGRRCCVLVLGMHRSGTSALTGCLTLLGCQAPRQLIDPCITNERGFFESWAIHALNEDLLLALRHGWSDCRPLPWRWLNDELQAHFRKRALDVIAQEYPGRSTIVLKDPRITRLLPFWLPVLDAADLDVMPVLIFRHPLEVALSLQDRDGLPLEQGYLLWLQHVLSAEHDSRRLPRAILSYSQLLEQRGDVFRRVALDIGIRWPFKQGIMHPTDPIVSIEAFLSEELRHHNTEGSDDSASRGHDQEPSMLKVWSEETYRILQRLSTDQSNPRDRSRLDALRKRLQQASILMAPYLPSGSNPDR